MPKNLAQSVGFEPTLPEGIWFLVRRLNHSATTASWYCQRCGVKLAYFNLLIHVLKWRDVSSWTCPQFSRDRIVVSTLRCGRNNPGSNPGHGMNMSYHGSEDKFWPFVLVSNNEENIKITTLPGFEPGIFWSVVRRVIRCATRPLLANCPRLYKNAERWNQ